MLLRSGCVYPDFQDATMSTEESLLSPPVTPAHSSSSTMPSHTLRVLHQNPAFKNFSGEDPCYSPVQFLRNCEDEMSNSRIAGEDERISFVRSHIVPLSLAADLMSSSAFTPELINHSYSQFKENFIKTFTPILHSDTLQFPFRFAEMLTKNFGAAGRLRGQGRAGEVATEAMENLTRANWFENGVMSQDRVRSLIEFLTYISCLTPSERRVASSLDFKPGMSLVDYAAKLAKRFSESPKLQTSVGDTSVEDRESSRASVAPVTYTATGTRPILTCSHCGRTGHTLRFCRRKKADAKKFAQSSAKHSNSQKSSATSGRDNQDHLNSSDKKPQISHKYCVIHGYTTHDTENCSIIQRHQQDFQKGRMRKFPP